MAASAEHPAVDADSTAESAAARPATEPARPRDSDPALIEQRMQAALAASTRTEASLSTLFRAVREMTEGLSGARDANEQLGSELGDVRRMLRQATQKNAELETQLTALKVEHQTALGTLAQLRGQAERDRAFLVEEQDRFLAALLEEHEETVAALEAKIREGAAPERHTTAPSRRAVPDDGDGAALMRELGDAKRTIETLMRERDRSREVLRRLQAQRDEAQRALDMQGRRQDAIRTVPRVAEEAQVDAPTPADNARNRRTDPLGPRFARAPVAAHPTPNPGGGSIYDRATAPPPEPSPFAPAPSSPMAAAMPDANYRPTPPPELRAAITAAPVVPRPSPLKSKPDPATRPIGGYSLRPEENTETVEAARISSKPPRR